MARIARRRLSSPTVYLILESCAAFLFTLIFTVDALYQVEVVRLSPFQLVLVGTILEATVFIFEIPTGVLADVKSRRLSIIIGYLLIGTGFLLQGSLPFFAPVAAAQVLWGLGFTFTSGATQAWVADEVGQERAGQAFLRGEQAARVGTLAAIPVSIALGSLRLNLPILLGGGLMILLAAFLTVAMAEEGFQPAPSNVRNPWRVMGKTVGDARQVVRRQPILWVLLAIGLFYGLYSEGLDRLWTPHLLWNFQSRLTERVQPVVWLGMIQAVTSVLSLIATEIARRRVDTGRATAIGRALVVSAGIIVTALAGFALSRSFGVAILLYWLVDVLRHLTFPLQTAWFNLSVDDPQVRATMFSASSQVDAIGQIAGGPAVGAVGNLSIRAALAVSALILSPVLPLYGVAIRRSGPAGASPQTRSGEQPG